jgi:hypothetical protein
MPNHFQWDKAHASKGLQKNKTDSLIMNTHTSKAPVSAASPLKSRPNNKCAWDKLVLGAPFQAQPRLPGSSPSYSLWLVLASSFFSSLKEHNHIYSLTDPIHSQLPVKSLPGPQDHIFNCLPAISPWMCQRPFQLNLSNIEHMLVSFWANTCKPSPFQ